MATLTIMVPDEVLRRAEARLGGHGYNDIQEYVIGVLHALATGGMPVDAQTEAALLEGLKSPVEEMTAADWQALAERAQRFRSDPPPSCPGDSVV